MIELPNLSLLSVEQKDDLIRLLFAEVKRLSENFERVCAELKETRIQLERTNAQLAISNAQLEKTNTELLKVSTELMELKNRQKKNSENSNKPPSSDGFNKKTVSLRPNSGKKPGGQKGHAGNTLKQSAEPNKIIQSVLPEHCDQCGLILLQNESYIKQRRQVFDIPITTCEVVEYQSLELICGCGKRHVSEFPQDVTEFVQYGSNLRALGVYLTQGQLLPFARTAELLQDLYGVKVSTGTIVNWVEEGRVVLQSTADFIADHLSQAGVVHADESGLRVAGTLNWLHVVADTKFTWYGVHAKRGMHAIQAQGILTKFFGVLVHDCWKSYWEINCVHALCNAHLLRELTYLKEITQETWPQKMIDFLVMANKICEVHREKEIPFSEEIIDAFHVVYESILCEGEALHPRAKKQHNHRGACKQSLAFNLLLRLRLHTNAVLLFVRNLSVPFTNNLAEQAIRMPKIKQKISGSFRTGRGAENFAIIRSCLDTLRKQGHRMFDTLRHAFAGNPVRPTTG